MASPICSSLINCLVFLVASTAHQLLCTIQLHNCRHTAILHTSNMFKLESWSPPIFSCWPFSQYICLSELLENSSSKTGAFGNNGSKPSTQPTKILVLASNIGQVCLHRPRHQLLKSDFIFNKNDEN